MSEETGKLTAFIGVAGQQGSGVVKALKADNRFRVRALTRTPEKYKENGVEVVAEDITTLAISPLPDGEGILVLQLHF